MTQSIEQTIKDAEKYLVRADKNGISMPELDERYWQAFSNYKLAHLFYNGNQEKSDELAHLYGLVQMKKLYHTLMRMKYEVQDGVKD